MSKSRIFTMSTKQINSLGYLWFILFLYLLLFCGCTRKSELINRDVNGKLVDKFIVMHDSANRIKYLSYHSNGALKEEGYLHYGVRTGIWKQYYSDGIIRWLGEYRNGKREGSSIDTSEVDRIKILFKGFTKDNKYAFRFVSIDSISPDDLMYGTNNAEITKIKNFDSCDFLMKPLNNDTIHLQIYAVAKYGVFTIFDKKIDHSMLKKLKN